MRNRFDEQLALLNKKIIEMGALCEKLISLAATALLESDSVSTKQISSLGPDVDHMEREIESICLKLLLQQQPVARDYRYGKNRRPGRRHCGNHSVPMRQDW